MDFYFGRLVLSKKLSKIINIKITWNDLERKDSEKDQSGKTKEDKGMMHMRGKVFGIVTVILVLIIIFCVKGTVMSRERSEHARVNRYYAALEQEYLERTHKLLEEEGLRNCGVNLRWVTDEGGNREYTILLHHRKLNRMSEEEKSVLAIMLSKMEFRHEACRFQYEL